LSAQTKGVVMDSISKLPIPYVSIWVENENIGVTSEENGNFEMNTIDKNKNLIFSALGYAKKKVRVSKAATVYLNPTAYQLDEIVLINKKETRKKEIGITDSETSQAFDNGPKIDTKFFSYLPQYKKTKFIKQVAITTDSRIENAAAKIHFYSVDANGFPGEELLGRDFIVTVNKGVKKTYFDVGKLNLRMPKNGIFVAFEKLIIEKNKLETTSTDAETKADHIKKIYYPFILYNWVEGAFFFSFSGGKWQRQTPPESAVSKEKWEAYEPAINLILTN
jgi:hypothetical protein